MPLLLSLSLRPSFSAQQTLAYIPGLIVIPAWVYACLCLGSPLPLPFLPLSPPLSHSHCLDQEHGKNLGSSIWDSGVYLAKYLATESDLQMKDARVIELGCGVGLPGLGQLRCRPVAVVCDDLS